MTVIEQQSSHRFLYLSMCFMVQANNQIWLVTDTNLFIIVRMTDIRQCIKESGPINLSRLGRESIYFILV